VSSFGTRFNSLGDLTSGKNSTPDNQVHQRLGTKDLDNMSKPISKPIPPFTTAAEAAGIAASRIDLEALKVVAAQAAQAVRTRVLAVDVEKHEAGPELLEIAVVELDLCARSARTTHFIIEYAKGTLRKQYYMKSDPEGFAYRGRIVRCSLSEAVAHVQLAVDRCAGGYVVGHSLRSADIPWLEGAGVKFDPVITIDIAAVEKAVAHTHQPMSLEQIATAGYELSLLAPSHNAGNDAVATAAVFAEQLRRYTGYRAGWIAGELRHPDSPLSVLSTGQIPLHAPSRLSKPLLKFRSRPPPRHQHPEREFPTLANVGRLILRSPILKNLSSSSRTSGLVSASKLPASLKE
jgi:DNA polymerase III epsilon subunit-like protein